MSDHHHLRTGTSVGVVDHMSALSSHLGELVKSNDYSDITLLVEGTHFPAHKVVLAARSEYFRALLFGGLREAQPGTTEIELKDTSAAAFSVLLQYIYSGVINLVEIKEENLLDILALSHRYVFLDLELAISEYLKAILSIHNVCMIYDLANIYNLSSLCQVCKEFMDVNAMDILQSEAFLQLSESSVVELISRDSFCAKEKDIFKAVWEWVKNNQETDATRVLDAVRLQLMSMEDLFDIVRPSEIVSPNKILDAIQIQFKRRNMDLKYRGLLVLEENVATSRHGCSVKRGEMKSALLDGDNQSYDLDRGFSRHPIDDNYGQGIVVELGQPFIINTIKLLLWDRDSRSYSYYIEVSMDDKDYEEVVNHRNYLCRSWQILHFPSKVVKFIRIVGTNNTVNRVFHLVSLECLYTQKPFTLSNGLIVPSDNVANGENNACVIEGVSRSRNALINGDTKHYDWDSGYTCHQLGSGSIIVQLAQPYMVNNMRLLLWDCDERSYSYYVEVSANQKVWKMVADKRKEACKSWQIIQFEKQPVAFIKIVGTHNTANEVFHCVHFECPIDATIQLANSVSATSVPSASTSSAVSLPEPGPSVSVESANKSLHQFPSISEHFRAKTSHEDATEADRADADSNYAESVASS